MRLGISSFTYPWAVGLPGHRPAQPLTPLGLIRRAADLGVPLVQIADNMPLGDLPPGDIDALAAEAEERHIFLELGTRGVDARLHDHVGLARRLGSPFVRIVIDSMTRQPSLAEARQTLRAFEQTFREAGVLLAIENHDRFTAEQLAELVTDLGDWVGVCLDTANSFGATQTPRDVVDVLGGLAINLHLKDFTIRRAPHQLGFAIEGRPAGSGMLDIPWLLETLTVNPRLQSAVLELWTPPQSSLEATIAQEEEWADQSLQYLRGLKSLDFSGTGTR